MPAFSQQNKQPMLQTLTRKHMKFRLTRFVAAPGGCLTCFFACPPVQRFAQLFFVTLCVVVRNKRTAVWSTCGESGNDSLLPHEGAKDCNNSHSVRMKKVLENKEMMVLYCYSNLNKRGQTDGVYYLTCRSTRLQIGVYLLFLKKG